jgi:hypothetical protein
MVVAVRAVRMVQMALHEIIDVIPVWNRRVPAVRAVDMIIRVPATAVVGGARAGIGRAHRELMFFHLAVGQLVMQVPIVQVVDMALVFNGRVTAV